MFGLIGSTVNYLGNPTLVIPSLMFGADTAITPPCIPYEINDTTLRNSNVDQFAVSTNVTDAYSTDKPDKWDNNTIMNATFEESIDAGNLDFFGSQVSEIIVQRQRVYKDKATEWQTIYRYDATAGALINPENPLDFEYDDHFVAHGETYHYRLVPVTIQGGTAIEYEERASTSEPITAVFDGVFICDGEVSIRLYGSVEYGNMDINQEAGVHATLGNKYPIVVMNGQSVYRTGEVSGLILPDDFGKITSQLVTENNVHCIAGDNCHTIGAIEYTNRSEMKRVELDRHAMVEKRKEIEDFLTNKRPKVVKDWNGNMWLVIFTENPSITFDSNWGMGMATISGSWTEIGDPYNENDMYYAGMIGRND